MSVTLHAPDEPVVHADVWRAELNEGTPIGKVISGPDGITDWAWSRWRAIEDDGISRDDLELVLQRSGRELWLWLMGERTWAQAIATVLGRLSRLR